MEAFSPVGANLPINLPSSAVSAGYRQAEVLTGYKQSASDVHSRPFSSGQSGSISKPSTLRTEVNFESPLTAIETSKKRFPLLERLQTAIQTIEHKSPASEADAGDMKKAPSHSPLTGISQSIDRMKQHEEVVRREYIADDHKASRQEPARLIDYDRVEQMIEVAHRKLHDRVQSDLHSLHMDMLKQCLAVQKHQESLLALHLPQVGELLGEIKCLREENARLKNRLRLE